jgi:choline dehydrogenase-like flavoprotein
MDADFDIIVIGSGAGGGTLASVCAAAGRNVLLAERGGLASSTHSKYPASANGLHDEHSTLIQKQPYDDRHITLNETATRLYMGGVAGGGTSVYGGALLRPHPADFSPGRYYSERIPREIHDWPLSFDSFAPYLAAAERLYHVTDVRDPRSPGSPQAAVSAFDQTLDGHGASAAEVTPSLTVKSGIPLARINEKLVRSAWNVGLNPYRLPLAIDASKCLRCDNCAGFVCPTGARRSSGQLVRESIDRGDSLTLKTQCEAEELERGVGGQLRGVWLKDRVTGSRVRYTAKRYVLSAGAIGSAALLLKSGFDHPMIGRNYMMHYSPISIGLFLKSTGATQTFIKQIGSSDYYFGTRDLPEKMGIVQSLPAPGPWMMAKTGMKWVPHWMLKILRSHMLPLVGIVEDLPSPDNRVSLDQSGAIQLQHQFSDYDRTRGAELSRRMSDLLKSTGAVHCVSGLRPSQEHVAHQCGTIRFGLSRDYAVADAECRLFDQPDVFVVDGSFMPTSLGVGPSLTIIANALRVAEIVASEV